MEVLRWPSGQLLFTAPPGWEVLLLYMMGPDADAIYRCVSRAIKLFCHCTAVLHSLRVREVHIPLSIRYMVSISCMRNISGCTGHCKLLDGHDGANDAIHKELELPMRGLCVTCRSPPSLWVQWHSKIFSAGAYIIHRPAMRKLMDALLPGKGLVSASAAAHSLLAVFKHLLIRSAAEVCRSLRSTSGLLTSTPDLPATHDLHNINPVAGASTSGVMKAVDLTPVNPRGCQSERVMFSQVMPCNSTA